MSRSRLCARLYAHVYEYLVDREVDGQHAFHKYFFFIFFDGSLGVVLVGSKGLCGQSWAALRASVGGPGPLSEPLWAVLGRLGAFVDGAGPSWVRSWVLL